MAQFVPPTQPVTLSHQLPTSIPLPVLPAIEAAKRLAAFSAVDRHIGLEHKVIGIGSGSTVPYCVDRIVAQGKEANRGRVFVPTGKLIPVSFQKGSTLMARFPE